MSLVTLFISRHILSASLSIVIVLLGLLSYFRIGVDRHPDVEFLTLSITTGLPGMSAQNIALTLTQPLESRLNIGMLLLMGLVAKNSILLIDRTNQLIGKGLGVHEALQRACPDRLRPIAMTSVTVVLALLPAAFGVGPGSENNQPLSIAVIGGMLSSTLLTLLVIPAAYYLFVRPRVAQAAPESVSANLRDFALIEADFMA